MGFGAGGAFSDIQVVNHHRYRSGNAIILEQTIRARHTGVWEGLAPTLRWIEVTGCTVGELDRWGRLISVRPYLDRWMLWQQIQARGEGASIPRARWRTGGPTLRIMI